MYEKTGLGWSEPSWNWLLHAGKCDVEHDEMTREVCFEPGEQPIAQATGCVQRLATLTGAEIGCTTEADREGALWCCRPGFPRPHAGTSTTQPPGSEPEIPSLPLIPEFKAPTADPASFFTKLMHPGSLLAIGFCSVAGVLIYHNLRGAQDEL